MLACLKGIFECCSYPFGIYFFYTLEANLEGFFVCFCFLRMSAGGQGQEIPCCFSSHWEMLLGWEVPGTSHPGQGAP